MNNIGFVPTANGKEEAYWFGIKMPFFFTWTGFKLFYKLLSIKAKALPELREETYSRLEKALNLYQKGRVEEIFVSGGYSKLRKVPVVQLMANWLISKGVPRDKIFYEDFSVETSGNVQGLADFVRSQKDPSIKVIVITSHYHVGRATRLLKRSLPSLVIESEKVFPPLTRDCLKDEYLWNLLTEPFKIVISVSSVAIGFLSKKERIARDNFK